MIITLKQHSIVATLIVMYVWLWPGSMTLIYEKDVIVFLCKPGGDIKINNNTLEGSIRSETFLTILWQEDHEEVYTKQWDYGYHLKQLFVSYVKTHELLEVDGDSDDYLILNIVITCSSNRGRNNSNRGKESLVVETIAVAVEVKVVSETIDIETIAMALEGLIVEVEDSCRLCLQTSSCIRDSCTSFQLRC